MIAANPPEPEKPQDAGGNGGLVLATKRHRRSDARLIARLMSLGVVKPSRIRDLLEKGFDLAEASANEGDARGYSACMKIAIEAVKLEQKELERTTPTTVKHEHSGTIGISPTDGLSDRIEAELIAERERRRAIVDGTVIGNGNGSGDQSNGHSGTNGSQPG